MMICRALGFTQLIVFPRRWSLPKPHWRSGFSSSIG